RGLLAAFDQDQTPESRGPAPPPNADGMPFATEAGSDLLVVPALESEQDHVCPLGEGLSAGARTRHGLQDILLAFGNNDLGGPPWHGTILPSVGEIGGLGKYRKTMAIVEARFSQGVLGDRRRRVDYGVRAKYPD